MYSGPSDRIHKHLIVQCKNGIAGLRKPLVCSSSALPMLINLIFFYSESIVSKVFSEHLIRKILNTVWEQNSA